MQIYLRNLCLFIVQVDDSMMEERGWKANGWIIKFHLSQDAS